MGFLAALLPLLTGSLSGLKDWFQYKQQAAKATQDYQLAVLQAQAEQAKQQAISDSTDLANRLNSTTQQFKQITFWLLWFPVLFTMLFPDHAVALWNNYQLVPAEFRYLFQAVYCAIWGLPLLKGGWENLISARQDTRDYKIEKIKAYNDKAFYDIIKSKLFTHGLTEEQVSMFNQALKARDGD